MVAPHVSVVIYPHPDLLFQADGVGKNHRPRFTVGLASLDHQPDGFAARSY